MRIVGNPPPRHPDFLWAPVGQDAPVDPDWPGLEPVTEFAIPTVARPKAIADAADNFERLALEFTEVKCQLAEAKELRQHEIGQANEAARDSRLEGTKRPTKTADKVAAEWDAKQDALRAELKALAQAVDRAGDSMVVAVETHRHEWLAALDKLDEEATQRLAKTLVEAKAAVADLMPARACPWWLREFNADSAINPHGSQSQYPGGSSYGTGAFKQLEALVTPERRMIGRRDDDGDGTAEAIYEEVVVR